MEVPLNLDAAVRGKDGAVQLWLRVQPGASRSRLVGMHGERLKVALQAPPVDGKANDELIRYLAEILDLPRARLELASGASSRDKRVDVAAAKAIVIASLQGNLVPQTPSSFQTTEGSGFGVRKKTQQ